MHTFAQWTFYLNTTGCFRTIFHPLQVLHVCFFFFLLHLIPKVKFRVQLTVFFFLAPLPWFRETTTIKSCLIVTGNKSRYR